MTDSLVLDQTLHGYDRGHRLLTSSLRIGPEDDRAMLTMSDLSGSRVVEGFMEYVTGYMLPSNTYFALAKTWYASEMKRPGCVWTHSLLIPTAALKTVQNAEALLSLFVRPSLTPGFRYSDKLEIPDAAFHYGAQSMKTAIPARAGCLLEELYSVDKGSVGLAAKSGSEMESFLLNVWSQLWPELRAKVSFCSGSLSLRSLNGRPLDLQCGPDRILRDLSTADSPPCSESLWEQTIFDDLLHPGQFRAFLQVNGAGLSSRTSMASLAKVYGLAVSGDIAGSLSVLAEVFPLQEQGVQVKRTIIHDATNAVEKLDLASVLKSVSQQSYASVSSSVADLLRHFARLSSRKLAEVFAVLGQTHSDEFESLMVDALADSLSQQDFEWLSDAIPELFDSLLTRRPAIAYGETFWNWNFSVFEKVDIFRMLLRNQSVDKQALFDRLFSYADPQLLSRIVSDLSTEQVPQVLQWIQSHEHAATSLEWTSFLSSHRPEFIDWLNHLDHSNLQTVILAANVLDVSPPIHTVLSEASIERLALGARGIPADRHEVAAFLFVTTAWVPKATLASVFIQSFVSLHRGIAQNRLSNRAWQLIAPTLMPLPEAQWDSCEKLRRTALHFIFRNAWDANILWRYLAEDLELFYDFTRTAKSYGQGRELMEGLYEASQRGSLSLGKKQTKELRKLLGKSRW